MAYPKLKVQLSKPLAFLTLLYSETNVSKCDKIKQFCKLSFEFRTRMLENTPNGSRIISCPVDHEC